MIVGLAGFAGVGKDTVADYLVEHYGFKKMSFADPIRAGLLAVNPFIDVDGYNVPLSTALEHFTWDELKNHSEQIRPLLQRFGTEFGRNQLGQDLWVEMVRDKMSWAENIVFSDVRFKNEVRMIRAERGQVWNIFRRGTGAANEHISEWALLGFDFDNELANDDEVASLLRQAEFALDSYMDRRAA